MDVSLLSIVVPASGIIITLVWQQRVAQLRATVDLAVSQKQDEHLILASKTVSKLIKSGAKFTEFCTKHESDEYQAILRVINNHEIVASGLRLGAYNEKLYKRMRHTAVIQTWSELKGFINQLRSDQKSDTLYQDFEWLAKKWLKKPLKSS